MGTRNLHKSTLTSTLLPHLSFIFPSHFFHSSSPHTSLSLFSHPPYVYVCVLVLLFTFLLSLFYLLIISPSILLACFSFPSSFPLPNVKNTRVGSYLLPERIHFPVPSSL
uniref:Uncharacterized protein n=1 Tax=Trypanosoma vivax (strain Y486) TaxID=1055687 RepID=G0TTZ9_TRYVY|nr:hypothetical protein, unlikely [Trypanosoma vivax Y486]